MMDRVNNSKEQEAVGDWGKSYCRKGYTDPYPNFQVQKGSEPLWDLDMQLPIVAKGNEYRNFNFLSF